MQQQSTEKKIRDNVAQYLEIEEKKYNLLKNFEMDNYQKLFTQAIEEQKNSAKIIDASFNKFKLKSQEMDATSLGKSFAKFQTELKMWTLSNMALSNSIIERKKNDFLEGGFFIEKRAEKFYSIESPNLPDFHKKAVEELKNLQNKIVDERELGNFPMKAIEEHEKLLRKAHENLHYFVDFKMDKNSESTKKLIRSIEEFEKFTKFPTFIIPGSDNNHIDTESSEGGSFDKSGNLRIDFSRDATTGNNPFFQNGAKGHGLPPLKGSPRIGGYDFLFYGTIAALTLLAGRYISKQLNAKAQEKPVEEKFNTEELKKISPLFGNENIAIAPQKVQFNNFQKKLAEDIERFFKDYENIKTTINDKGLTLNLKNLSAKKGNKVFSTFLEEFKDDFVNEFKDIPKRQDAEKKLVSQKEEIRDLKELVNNNIGDTYNILQNPKKAELIRKYLKELDELDTKVKNLDDLKFIRDNSKKFHEITKDPEDEETFKAREEKYITRVKGAENPDPNPAQPEINLHAIKGR